VFSCSVAQGYFGIARRGAPGKPIRLDEFGAGFSRDERGALAAGETCRLFTAGRNRQRRRLLWSVEHSRVVQLEVGSLVILEPGLLRAHGIPNKAARTVLLRHQLIAELDHHFLLLGVKKL